jgi:hypothetical protein
VTSVVVRKRAERRKAWFREALIAVAGHGHPLDKADVSALPLRFRDRARTIAKECALMFEAGDQQLARTHAQEEFAAIDAAIRSDWEAPDAEGPDPELINRIRGGF